MSKFKKRNIYQDAADELRQMLSECGEMPLEELIRISRERGGAAKEVLDGAHENLDRRTVKKLLKNLFAVEDGKKVYLVGNYVRTLQTEEGKVQQTFYKLVDDMTEDEARLYLRELDQNIERCIETRDAFVKRWNKLHPDNEQLPLF